MFKFKVKYTGTDGKQVEVEIAFNLSILDKLSAASKLGISPQQILTIRKI